jgi:hypothetical protein
LVKATERAQAIGFFAVTSLCVFFPSRAGAAEGDQKAEPAAAATNSERERLRYYEQHFVTVRHEDIGGFIVPSSPMMPGGGYALPTEIWEGYRGQSKEKLGILEFYDAVDRPDLKKKVLTHKIFQASFAVVGAGLLVGGGIYQYSHWDDEGGPPTAGWILLGAGVA